MIKFLKACVLGILFTVFIGLLAIPEKVEATSTDYPGIFEFHGTTVVCNCPMPNWNCICRINTTPPLRASRGESR